MLRLHRQKATLYRKCAPVEWSSSLRSFCVYNPDSMVAILRSADFEVVDYATEYSKLGQRTHLDWSELIGSLHYIPLANEGQRHAKLRRDFAQLIIARSASAKTAVAGFVAKTVPLIFLNRQHAELMQELIRPATDVLFGELLGVPVPEAAADNPSASQIFDRSLGLNRRMRVQNSIARLTKSLAADPALAISKEYATALIIVGHDSLLASLGASLVSVLEHAMRLCDIDFPHALPQTGVPYVERVARRDCTIHGFDFRAGDRVRLFLDACPVRGPARNEAPYFGKGRHLCLGKDLSQWVWQVLVRELRPLPVRVSITEAIFRANDYVFNMYDRIEVSIHE